ncbi:MAG: response regulator [Candidatus Thermoplasmatota archaeon]|nr:response regulator [Candidatus Thermoplasmatota archaeon]
MFGERRRYEAPANLSGGTTTESALRLNRHVGRVFIVDDQDFIRELYKDVFESRGFTVFSARSGEEAVRIFQTMKSRPDAIIMDHRMQGKDGIQTTKEILRMAPGMPIIFSSADESVREQALEAGAVSFWAKPFPVSLLVDAMVDLLRARRTQ